MKTTNTTTLLLALTSPCFLACGADSDDRSSGPVVDETFTGDGGDGADDDGSGDGDDDGDGGGDSDGGGDDGDDDGSDGDDDGGGDDDGDGDGGQGCEAGSKTGATGASNGLQTEHGVVINLRTPDDYDPTVRHPLIMVFAPAGANASTTEQFTGLTTPAIERGYIIAYADHIVPETAETIANDAAIAGEIAAVWCIDEDRIFLTGHSNGGSIAGIAVAVADEPPLPRAAAPSAAGAQGPTMQALGCPDDPHSMMVIHSAGDQLFPISDGFGESVAEFWAGCANCAEDPSPSGPCVAWNDCDEDNTVLYCETSGPHGQWYGLNTEMLDFFDGVPG